DLSGDVVSEGADGGTDKVLSSDTYTLSANVENLTLTGSAAIDGTGNDLGNAITGNDAANVLDGSAGLDTLEGGLGDDTYVVDLSGDVVTEGVNAGTDYVLSSDTYTLSANVENLTLTGTAAIDGTGNALNNAIIGNVAANTLVGDGGDDILSGAAGDDVMIGGAGDDIYVVSNLGDVVVEDANGGTDIVKASVNVIMAANVEELILTGTAAINGTGNGLANAMTGNAATNTLDGGIGNDTLNGAEGADLMIGGSGNDVYVVDNVGDMVSEGANGGTDYVQSSATHVMAAEVENLLLTGTAAINGTGNGLDNVITGNDAANTLVGGAGDDNLIGNLGADTLIGGLGNDFYQVAADGDVIIEGANSGTDVVLSNATWTLGANLEDLTLIGSAAIKGFGNGLANVMTGNVAANTLDGGDGDDVLNGAEGADVMIGGSGNDVYVVDNAGDTVSEGAGGGTDYVLSSDTCTLSANVENLTLTGTAAIDGYGNGVANSITGNSAANALDGGVGADTLTGGLGDDYYWVDNAGDTVVEQANEGNDAVRTYVNWTLGANLEILMLSGTSAINGTGNGLANTISGNSGNNVLDGGAGADTLTGREGDDTLIGGAGADTLIGSEGADVYKYVNSTEGGDSIIAFIHGQDKLTVVSSNFGNLSVGALASSAFALSTQTQTTATRFIYNASTGVLSYDADGVGTASAAVTLATLTGGTGFSASDVTVVSS
ncbi:MAG TPA: calcium-binding protein, partial [Magnetospirillum sp.]|nr:calcium-binding protein [Magnetospirillum sp.]